MDTQFNFRIDSELLRRAKVKAGSRPISDVLREFLEGWLGTGEERRVVGMRGVKFGCLGKLAHEAGTCGC